MSQLQYARVVESKQKLNNSRCMYSIRKVNQIFTEGRHHFLSSNSVVKLSKDNFLRSICLVNYENLPYLYFASIYQKSLFAFEDTHQQIFFSKFHKNPT